MPQKPFRSSKLFSDFNTFQFAGVMAIVMFVLLITLMVQTTPYHHGSVDLPKVSHSVSMPGAQREDCMKVSVTRDGSVYFGSDRVAVADLQQKIAERLKDRGVECKVYIVADMRARWGTLKPVLDGVRSAGILRVGFLVNQRSS
jgi:biopolymer transport protein TolR